MTDMSFASLALSLRLAAITTAVLLVIATPLAWWLARTPSRLGRVVSALVALPLVLPPTVLGFYLLVTFGPQGWGGALTQALGLGTLPFSFGGLVMASVLASLPFAVQPLQVAFEQQGPRPFEVAATLRASPLDAFFTVALPLAWPGLLTAAILAFAHTIGEFGVLLMVGGNIPGVTRTASIQIYDHVEALETGAAHALSAVLVLFAFAVLLPLQSLRRRRGTGA